MYQSLLESVPMLKTLEVSVLYTNTKLKVKYISILSQPYELLNLADALERRYFSDGDCIIKEVHS